MGVQILLRSLRTVDGVFYEEIFVHLGKALDVPRERFDESNEIKSIH